MLNRFLKAVSAFLVLVPAFAHAQDFPYESAFGTAERLAAAGFRNVRSAETDTSRVFTIENDLYKIQAEGIARAIDIVEGSGYLYEKPVKIVVTDYNVPQLTLIYNKETGNWKTTSRIDDSWKAVRNQKRMNESFGKVDITVYPQLALKNLIITQVYQTLWQISPSVDVSLWPGMKLSYQVKFPVYNDGYGDYEGKIHPGMVTLSQRFRDPWNLNVFGRISAGFFNNSRHGVALDLKYIFPNERFSVDGQVALIGLGYFNGFNYHFDKSMNLYPRWNVAANYYWPIYQTQFTLRAQEFIMGDKGVKFEMIRHFRHCSIGFYAMKGLDTNTNGGFRFQVALPPYRMKRHGYLPRVTTSANMGMVYNANNEQYYYKEFKTEASDNIMTLNSFNPYYVAGELKRYR